MNKKFLAAALLLALSATGYGQKKAGDTVLHPKS